VTLFADDFEPLVHPSTSVAAHRINRHDETRRTPTMLIRRLDRRKFTREQQVIGTSPLTIQARARAVDG